MLGAEGGGLASKQAEGSSGVPGARRGSGVAAVRSQVGLSTPWPDFQAACFQVARDTRALIAQRQKNYNDYHLAVGLVENPV